METRGVTEYRYFVLNLAGMHGGVDKSIGVAIFEDIEKLKSYYNSQLADKPWTDKPSMDAYGNKHSWSKVFKKGSPLEWYNPLSPINSPNPEDIFQVVSHHDAAFGGVTEYWTETMGDFTIPLNPIWEGK